MSKKQPEYEIRLRGVSKEMMDKVRKIGLSIHEKQVPGTVTKLINRFEDDQKAIRELQRRNTELTSLLNGFYGRERRIKEIIEQTAKIALKTGKNLTVVAKHFNTKQPKKVIHP